MMPVVAIVAAWLGGIAVHAVQGLWSRGGAVAAPGSAARTIADLQGKVLTARLVAVAGGAAAVGVVYLALRRRGR